MARPGLGIVIAEGMPPPGKLRAAMMRKKMGDEGGGMPEDSSEPEVGEDEDYGEGGGEKMAFGQMVKALDAGDTAGAFDAFREAVRITVANMKAEDEGEPAEGPVAA